MLISNSTMHGGGWLDHCAGGIRRFLDRVTRHEIHNIVHIPYALGKQDWDKYSDSDAARFAKLGYNLVSVHRETNPLKAVQNADAIFVRGGNTWLLLQALQEENLLIPIRSAATQGVPYIGVSAGTNIAGPTIRTTNDWRIADPTNVYALDLVPFQINPHFIDADPGSTYGGETREDRIKEFHEHHRTPVVGLREGAWIEVEGDGYTLRGINGAKIFFPGNITWEWAINETTGAGFFRESYANQK